MQSVVFFGTGPVAAKSLELINSWADVETVITKPKPEGHRGSYPVLEVANKLKLPVLTVKDKQSLDELFARNLVNSRCGVLVDFGIIVSQAVIDYFPLGIVNSHFSLLPEWRGADPISFAILSGQKTTGVSLMLLVQKMDEGPLLAIGTQDIAMDTTTPLLTEQLIHLSDSLLKVELPRYLAGTTKPVSQKHPEAASYSRKLSKEDSQLDFGKPAVELEREIRAFVDWPKSRARLVGQEVIITRAHVEKGKGVPGSIWHVGKGLGFYTANDILAIDRLKPAGKPEMPVEAFLAGHKL